MSEEAEKRVRALELEVGQLRSALESQGIIERPETPGEMWGYSFWGAVVALIAIPELLAAFWPLLIPWATIAATVEHLGTQGTLLLGVILALYAQAGSPPPFVMQAGGELPNAPERRRVISPYHYFPIAIAGVILPSVLAATLSSRWNISYAIYGSIAIYCVLLPNTLAYVAGVDVPFPTFSRTLGYLERRYSFAAKVIRAGVGLLRPPSR